MSDYILKEKKYSKLLKEEVVDGKKHYIYNALYHPSNVEKILMEGGCTKAEADFFSADPQRSMVIINLLIAQDLIPNTYMNKKDE